jgi:hypothetical protein
VAKIKSNYGAIGKHLEIELNKYKSSKKFMNLKEIRMAELLYKLIFLLKKQSGLA